MDYSSITGKVVLITGASGGIGAGTAALFAKHGAKLALTGRDQEALGKTSLRCQEAGAKADDIYTKTGDIKSEDDIKTIVDGAVAKFGGIDILINSAGIVRPGVFLTVKMDDYDDVINTNIKGVFAMCKAAMPHIVERKGSIINVSSFTGLRPSFAYISYSIAEACLDQFTRALALELGPKGVRVNSVNPGILKDTDFLTRAGAPLSAFPPKVQEGAKNKMKDLNPMKRSGEVKDIAPAILFLASDQASYIHGATLPIDGGKTLTAKGVVESKPTP